MTRLLDAPRQSSAPSSARSSGQAHRAPAIPPTTRALRRGSGHLLFLALTLALVAMAAAVLSPTAGGGASPLSGVYRQTPADAAFGSSSPAGSRAADGHAAPTTAAGTPRQAQATSSAGGPSRSVRAATAMSAPGGGPYLPYTADSFFLSPLPAVTPVSPTSAAEVAYAKAQDADSYLKIRGANGVGWGIAYGLGTCSDPLYRIGPGGNLPASQQYLRDVGFHAPASTWQNIPPNSDAPFLVVDTCGTPDRPQGSSVWGSGTSVSGNTVSIASAGSFTHDSNGLDRRNPLSNSALNERSRGVIPDSMAIRLDRLDWAIRHGSGLGYVVEVFWPGTDSAAGFSTPMVAAEGGKTGLGAEGDRFRIKPGIDLATRPGCSPTTNPVGLAIARTLQDNGAYIGDNSGSGAGIKTEQNAQFPGLNADSLRGCMTWDDIEFLPRGWTN